MNENLKKEAEAKAKIIVNYYQSGNFDLAIANAKRLLKKFPNYIILLNIIGLSLHAQKKFNEAISYFNKSLQINPNYFLALNNIALAYRALGDNINAQNFYEKAIDRNPKFAVAISNLANLKKDLGLINEAIELYKNALVLDNNLFLTHYNLALIYQSIGKTDIAKKYFLSSLKINPSLTIADKQLSMSIKYDPEHNHLKKMEKKISDNILNDNQKIQLYFALGKAYEDCKEYKVSCEYFEKGNSLKRQYINYDPNYIQSTLNGIKTFFIKFKEDVDKINCDIEKKMIFIVGMPRSGTTLVDQILSSHKNVYGGGERKEFQETVYSHFINENIINNNKDFFKFNNINELKKIRTEYFDKIKKNINIIDEKYITDKNPINFKWIGIIKLLFPDSKIIHCSRNSKDICLSIYKNLFLSDWKWCYKVNEIEEFYKLYHLIMQFWGKNLNQYIYKISYENLISNNKKEIEKLLQFCGLPWDNSCLEFNKSKSPVTTMSIDQVRQPIYNTSINSWKNYEKYIPKLFSNL